MTTSATAEGRPVQGFWVASIYLLDLAYGGPEEGGWWFTVGEPALELGRHARVFPTQDGADRHARVLDRYCRRYLNAGRRDITSVLSEGQFEGRVDEGRFPCRFPARRPHFE